MGNIPVLKPQEMFHKGRDISSNLLRQIASDIELTIEEMLKTR